MTDIPQFPPPAGEPLARDPDPPPPGPSADADVWSPVGAGTTARPTMRPPLGPDEPAWNFVEITGREVLDIPGARETVVIANLDRMNPRIYVGSQRLRIGMFGRVVVPMADGTATVINVKARPPGFPVVTHEGREIFRLARPSRGEQAFLWGSFVIPLAAVGAGVLGVFAALGTVYGHINLVKRNAPTWIRIALPLLVWAGWIAIGVAVWTAVASSR